MRSDGLLVATRILTLYTEAIRASVTMCRADNDAVSLVNSLLPRNEIGLTVLKETLEPNIRMQAFDSDSARVETLVLDYPVGFGDRNKLNFLYCSCTTQYIFVTKCVGLFPHISNKQ